MRAVLVRLAVLVCSLQFALPVGWCCFVGVGSCCPTVVAAPAPDADACPCCPKPERPATPSQPAPHTAVCCDRPDAIPVDVSDGPFDLGHFWTPLDEVDARPALAPMPTHSLRHGADPPVHVLLCRWLC